MNRRREHDVDRTLHKSVPKPKAPAHHSSTTKHFQLCQIALSKLSIKAFVNQKQFSIKSVVIDRQAVYDYGFLIVEFVQGSSCLHRDTCVDFHTNGVLHII